MQSLKTNRRSRTCLILIFFLVLVSCRRGGLNTVDSKSLGSIQATKIITGEVSYCFLDNTGETIDDANYLSSGNLFCSGAGVFEQLGISDSSLSGQKTIIQLKVPKASFSLFNDVAVNNTTGCAILAEDKKVYCLGTDKGQLGNGNNDDDSGSSKFVKTIPPKQGIDYEALYSGNDYFCAATSSEIYCWGNNSDDRLFTQTDLEILHEPMAPKGLTIDQRSVNTGLGGFDLMSVQNATCILPMIKYLKYGLVATYISSKSTIVFDLIHPHDYSKIESKDYLLSSASSGESCSSIMSRFSTTSDIATFTEANGDIVQIYLEQPINDNLVITTVSSQTLFNGETAASLAGSVSTGPGIVYSTLLNIFDIKSSTITKREGFLSRTPNNRKHMLRSTSAYFIDLLSDTQCPENSIRTNLYDPGLATTNPTIGGHTFAQIPQFICFTDLIK